MFQPIALETPGPVPVNESAIQFLDDLARRITAAVFSEARVGLLLFQRLSVLLQRFNAILPRDSFSARDAFNL